MGYMFPKSVSTASRVQSAFTFIGLGLAAALLNITSAQADEPTSVLFGAAHIGPDGPSVLYKINPRTGEGAAVGSGIGFERVSGMAFDPVTRQLFATGERPDFTDTQVLIRIDPVTGLGIEVGPTLIETFPAGGNAIPDIAFDPADGQLYAWNFPSLDRQGGFFGGFSTIDIETGVATLIAYATGILADNGNGLAFVGDGELVLGASEYPEGSNCRGGFGSTPNCDDVLHNIEISTAAASIRALMTFPPAPPSVTDDTDPRINGMDYDRESRRIFASVIYGFGTQATNFLATLNPKTGTVRLVGPSIRGLSALAFFECPFVDDADDALDPIGCPLPEAEEDDN